MYWPTVSGGGPFIHLEINVASRPVVLAYAIANAVA